jgi:hypothetical protein
LGGVEEARILAITPPGSMERVLSDLRGELYRVWGPVSALALPPLLPLARWPLGLSGTESAAVLGEVACPLAFELERYERTEGYLFLSVGCPGLEGLRRRLDDALGVAARDPDPVPRPDLFPLRPGFLLAGPDLSCSVEEVSSRLAIPAERRFGSYGMSVYRVRTHAPPQRWWDQVSWEEEAHVPVKRSGRASAGSGARRARPAPAP